MKKSFLLLIGGLIALTSCNDDVESPLTVGETIDRDERIIQNYFEANDINDTIADPSGVYIKIINEGTGESPEDDSVVRIKYSFYSLAGNTLIDEVSDLMKLELENTISGLVTGMQYMKKGGEAEFYIPCRYAFFGTNSAWANEVIRFRVSLDEFTEDVDQMDDIIIQEYFSEKEITDVIKDDSGVYIQHIIEGTGESPASNSNVTVKYELYTLPNDERVPQSEEPVTFNLSNLIQGWRIGLPYMKEGGEAFLYIPSSAAYRGTDNELANEVLKYRIELVEIQ